MVGLRIKPLVQGAEYNPVDGGPQRKRYSRIENVQDFMIH